MSTSRRADRSRVFYEIDLRAFADTSGGSRNDLEAVVDKLGYLEWLGVECLLVTPFYPRTGPEGRYWVDEPLRVHRSFGDTESFVRLIEEAHDHGMTVISDLVLDHTSRDHDWFAASRHLVDGDAFGHYYVWRDADRPGYGDGETNWTFDEFRGQLYRHRLSALEPDLNLSDEDVLESMCELVRGWMRLGLDGFRIPGLVGVLSGGGPAPVLIGRISDLMKREFDSELLMAQTEAYESRFAELVDRFGGITAFQAESAAVNAEVLRGIRTYDATRVQSEIKSLPASRAPGLWPNRPSDHDGWSAGADRHPRISNSLRHERSAIELYWAILLAWPGSPIVRFGDELGMRDEEFSGSSATYPPLPWTAQDKALGILSAQDQQASPSSLMSWMRTMIHARRNHPTMATGTCQLVNTDNSAVLAFLRVPQPGTEAPEGTRLLCAFNLAPTPQAAHLQITIKPPVKIRDAVGGGPFRANTSSHPGLDLMFGPRGYYWLEV